MRRTDRQDVRVTKTMCGADCWTYHRLVVSNLNLRIQPARRPQGKKTPKRLDVSKRNQDSMRQAFLNNWKQSISVQRTPKENWTVFHKTIYSSDAATLGHPHLANTNTSLMRMMTKLRGFLKKNTDCTRHIMMTLAQYPRKQPTATFVRQSRPSKLRDMQDSWLRKKTEEIQAFADRKYMKKRQ